MYTSRCAPREPMDLRAYLEVAGPEGRPYRLPARTVDLSTAGAGLIAHRPVNIARVTAVIVEDRTATHHRQRRWRGRVVHEREIDEGRRLGISFDRPDQGPTITFRLQVAGRGERRVRLDRPFAVVEPAGPPPATITSYRVWAPAVAVPIAVAVIGCSFKAFGQAGGEKRKVRLVQPAASAHLRKCGGACKCGIWRRQATGEAGSARRGVRALARLSWRSSAGG